MITQKRFVTSRQLDNQSIIDIENQARALVQMYIENYDIQKGNPLQCSDGKKLMFENISLFDVNTKNIELTTRFAFLDAPIPDAVVRKLKILNIGDILMEITVYRVGSYCYWGLEVEFLQRI